MEPTYKLDRDTSIWSFDENNEPALRVDPGAVIEIETWDCFTGQVTSESDTLDKLDLNRINSATGPIAVNGAEPGDMLSVRLLDIRPNAQGASMTIPGWGQLHEKVQSPVTRIYQVANGEISMNERVKFPVRPMFGVIGVSPASGNISTFESGKHGGNLDDHMNGIGAVVHLPVFQSGGQLAIGDMHASMGDGEICGTGVEIGGTGIISVDLIKGRRSEWPITETADSIYTHGTSPDNIDDALNAACDEAMRLLVDQWSFSAEDAFMFLSVACDLGIAAYYHPSPGCATARMRIPKISAVPAAFKI